MKCITIPSENYCNDSVTTAHFALFKNEESECTYNNKSFLVKVWLLRMSLKYLCDCRANQEQNNECPVPNLPKYKDTLFPEIHTKETINKF
jgi:hypothetical protein